MPKPAPPPADLLHWPLDRFIEYARNPRRNDHAVEKIAAAIHEFGFRIPILAKSDGLVVDGHLRLKAARKLGLATVPVLLADDLTETQIKAFRLSVNRMAELAEWDSELLSLELQDLTALDYNLDLLGWDGEELAAMLNGAPDFEPGTEAYQGKLDELAPKLVTCPHCGVEFDSRGQE
jgi:ParB-like chromosome segregation protein Spo0J